MRKNNVLTGLMVSAATLGTVVLANNHQVSADDISSKIEAKDSKISSLTKQQQEAQDKVDQIQSKVDSIKKQQDDLEAQNTKLEAKSKSLNAEITKLSQNIVSRNKSLSKQAKSAQTDSSTSGYINTIVNSKSISDAVTKVTAMNEIVNANNKMLEEQKQDKEDLKTKQVENQKAINTVIANKEELASSAKSLTTQQAELKSAQLNLAAEKATAEDDKQSLLAQKAAADKAAAAAAAAEKSYKEKQSSAVSAAKSSATTAATTVAQTVSSTSSASSTSSQTSHTTTTTTTTSSHTTTTTSSTSTSGNTYPVGQCTWGVKQMVSWVGNYWGNANQWGASATAAGHSIGSTPRVGAVAVWPNDGGGYGHVAYVTGVQSSSKIQVMESNYAGNMSIGNYRGWFNPTTAGGGSVYYIYQ